MDGYTKVEISYKEVEKVFARDIVGFTDAEKEQGLCELYEELKTFQ